MPKYSKEMEEKIIACFEQEKRNSVIARELNIYRGALPSRRKKWLEGKQEQEKTETEPEKIVQQNHPDSHPLDPQIYTLIRYQGTHSQEEALSQAIETQHSFNPYLLHHGMKTPKEFVKFVEEKIQLERTNVEDLKIASTIREALIVDYKKTIAELEELLDERFEEGYQKGKNDHALLIPCTRCGKLITIVPGNESHRLIIDVLRECGIHHTDCIPKYNRVYD